MNNSNASRSKRLLLLTTMITLFLGVSCLKETSEETLKVQESSSIQEFLSLNDTLDFVVKSSGLHYHEMKAGTGLQPGVHDTAFVYYTVKTLTGLIVDSNLGTLDTLVFPVGEKKMLDGFDEGVSYMRSGGESLMLLPSSLAYGSTGWGYVGPYTPLIIKIDLVRVKPAN